MEERRFGPVWFIPGENRGKWPACHSVYIEGAGILIDPASNRDRLEELRHSSGVNEIWLSHWHEDHIAHLDLFDDIPLKISKQDAPMISDIELFLDGYAMHKPQMREFWKGLLLDTFHYKPRTPTEFLENGQIIQTDNLTVEVIHAPGHTAGHLSFFFREPAVLFMGDYDLTKFGPWYGDRQSSIQQTISSVNKLREIPAKVWLTCHEAGVFEENPGDLWDQFLGVIEAREKKLLDFLQEPRTMAEIINAWIVYRKPREPRELHAFGEQAIMGKHLEMLQNQDVVRLKNRKYTRLDL